MQDWRFGESVAQFYRYRKSTTQRHQSNGMSQQLFSGLGFSYSTSFLLWIGVLIVEVAIIYLSS